MYSNSDGGNMKKLWVLFLASALTAVPVFADSNKYWTYNSGTYDNDEILDGELDDKVNTESNTIIVNGGTFNGDIITGQSETGSALSNELRLVGGTINSANVKAGVSKQANADKNTVYVNNVTVSGNIFAGEGKTSATGNTVTLEKATVEYTAADPSDPQSTANSVIAGKGNSGEVKDNNLNITSASTLNTLGAAGYSEGQGPVSYNTVTVSGASKIGNTSGSNVLYGGYATKGNSFNNQISFVDAGAVESQVMAGYSDTGSVGRNLVVVEKADISGAVYGGYTKSGSQAVYNEVRLNGGQVSGTVAGGYSAGTGVAGGNNVEVSDSAVLANTAIVYGGYAEKGAAQSNQVVLSSASAGDKAYGGYSAEGTAESNYLTVNKAASGGTVLAGGYAAAGDASSNVLSLDKATLSGGEYYGGYGAKSTLKNTLVINEAVVSGTFYGGKSDGGTALGNGVTTYGAEITGNIYGGYSSDSASANMVFLESTVVNGDVYGGYTTSSSTMTATSNNTVVLGGNTVINGNFYGGNGAISKNNQLVLNEYVGTVNALNNFDNVTIYGLGSQVTFTTDVKDVAVQVYGRPTETAKIVAYTPNNSTMSLNRDVLGAYKYSMQSATTGSQTQWSVQGKYENELAKPYAQAQLAGLTLATLGDDILEQAFNEAFLLDTPNDTFAAVQYFNNSYETGSGFDMESVVVQAGRWFKQNENILGLYVQYAHGHYSTEPRKATGGIDGFGLGGFALLPYSDEGRFELIARGGYQKADFKSGELSSNLDSSTFYGGLSAGILQNISALQLYGKLNWMYRAEDKVHDDLGQSIQFKDVQSLAGKVGARLNFGTIARRYKPYVGVAGIYELDADSNVTVDGHRVSDVELNGLTGQAEIGISYDNNDTMMPLKSSLSVFGLSGQAEGYGVDLKLMFSF